MPHAPVPHAPVAGLLGAALILVASSARADRDTLILRGAWDYRDACAACHGEAADGTGPIASAMTPPPSDLTTLSERNGGTFPYERVFRVIDGRLPVEGHGTATMPVWGRLFLLEAERESRRAIVSPDPHLMVAGRIHALAMFLREIQGGREIAEEPVPEAPRRSWPEEDLPRPGRP